jgi:hypothetical protein
MENHRVAPMYMVEIFFESGIGSQKVRERVLQETGVTPAIYDKGTHAAAHHTLSLERLERISNKEGVIEITGEYDIGSWAASNEHRRHDEDVRSKRPSAVSSSQSTAAAKTKEPMKKGITESRKEHRCQLTTLIHPN